MYATHIVYAQDKQEVKKNHFCKSILKAQNSLFSLYVPHENLVLCSLGLVLGVFASFNALMVSIC